MKRTFHNLPAERQAEIKHICLQEFVEYGYDNASINRIVKKLGIAKGSFYNYISTKEDLYIELFEEMYREAQDLFERSAPYKTNDLFDRIDGLMSFSIAICRNNPLQYKLLLQSELDTASSMYTRIHKLRGELFQKSYATLFDNVGWSQYRFPREDILAIFSWLSAGIREDLRTRIDTGVDLEEFEEVIRHRLSLYKESLTRGIYKDL
ncbi:MAG: TetR/AcrR family transcriptional regulator [Anaerolineaceae bacterium]|nr:TetR/AcrR family transcriptional regulator [Anaerolineaceae bacterium]